MNKIIKAIALVLCTITACYAQQNDAHKDHHERAVDHIEGIRDSISDRVDSFTRRGRSLSCYRMISPKMRFPEQWLEYAEANRESWRKDWVEYFCAKPENKETCDEYKEKMASREEDEIVETKEGDDMDEDIEGRSAIGAGAGKTSYPTLLEIASSNPDFTLLFAAVSTQPDIVELLKGDGPFTIFAPQNSALEEFLKANNLSVEEALALSSLPDILKLHVLGSRLLAEDALFAVADGPIEIETLGGKVVAEKKGNDLYIGGARVIATDVMASNGVVHVVDAVVQGA